METAALPSGKWQQEIFKLFCLQLDKSPEILRAAVHTLGQDQRCALSCTSTPFAYTYLQEGGISKGRTRQSERERNFNTCIRTTPLQSTNKTKPRGRLLQSVKGSKEKHQQSKDIGQQCMGHKSSNLLRRRCGAPEQN